MLKFIYIKEEVENNILIGCLSVVTDGFVISKSKFIFETFNKFENINEKWNWYFSNNSDHLMLEDFKILDNKFGIDESMINLLELSFENNLKDLKFNSNDSNLQNLSYTDLSINLEKLFNRKPFLFELHFYFSVKCLSYAKYFEDNPDSLINLNLFDFYIKKENLSTDEYLIEDFLSNITELYEIVSNLKIEEISLCKNENDILNLIKKYINQDFLINGDLNYLTKILSKNLLLFSLLIQEKDFSNILIITLANANISKDEALNNLLEILILN